MDHLFAKWGKLKWEIRNKFILLFADYDGTLCPIASTPRKAVLSKSIKILLERISNNPEIKLVVISGRSLVDIKSKIGLGNVVYSGNHGLEIEGPKTRFKPIAPPGYRKILENIKNKLDRRVSLIRGVFVEDKGLSLSLHYRLAEKKQIPAVKTIFHETVIVPLVKNKIKIKSGKMTLEVRPPVDWDKGKVVLWLLSRQHFISGNKEVLPVYLGDDVTDEDAFKVLRNKGITVFVGKPAGSQARFYLNNTQEVIDFIRHLAKLKEA
ncbi:MAG: trehalose-phosphatase [Candidatus Omnitrophota bacterium]|jgi:trehalose-phosphatase